MEMKPHHNPLQTPDGYFDQFTDRLMQRIGEQAPQDKKPVAEAPVLKVRLRRFMRYAAAVIVAALCVGTGTYFYSREAVSTQDSLAMAAAPAQAIPSDDQVSDDYIDEVIDYELIANSELADYLTEAY